jgi:hypothetical protein
MKLKLVLVVLCLSSASLTGCQNLPVIGAQTVGAPSVPETSVTTISLADFRKEMDEVPADAKPARLADQLARFDQVRISESQRAEATQLIDQLAKRLRAAVQTETKSLHAEALKADTYVAGSNKVRKAGAIIALFPLSDDQKSFEEAEALAQAQGAVMTQLGIIRRKRYNLWAINALQNAQLLIDSAPYPTTDILDREGKKGRWRDAQDKATNFVKLIEPSFLEQAVAPFYGEVLSQLGKDIKDDRSRFLRMILDPRVQRKTLDDF